MNRALALFERNIGMGEADPLEERNDTGDGPDLADFDVVVRRTCSCGDQKLFDALVADGAQEPNPVPIGALFEGVFFADDLHAVAAGDKVAESGFGDHIRCFVS